ncbi:MAG: hypothetical protein JKY09_05215 [Crocinitomicaceae bacterium]|nr:hypothetical protein [Crocinitomicaceae bacterium]
MLKHVILISIFAFSTAVFGQEIKKENLSKQKQTYWDFNKTQIQSRGKYYVNEFGETTDKHGKWTYYDKFGEIEEVRNYYQNLLQGAVTLYYPNGKKRQEGFFRYDRQDSIYTEWYETGHVKVEGEYDMDYAVNGWNYYYRDGRLKSVEETKGYDNYLWAFYLPDSLHTQTIIEGHGELTTYYTTGRVKEWYNYKDGLKHGSFEEISTYGYTTLKGEFKNGEKHGTWAYYYYTGDKEKVSNYVEGVLNGDYKYFYDNGQLNVAGDYKNGAKEGEWMWYTNTGTRDMVGTFKEGKQHGDWTYWYPTGELSYNAHYTHGVQTGQWSYFYKNGSKFKEGTFAVDLKNGTWKTWYEDETLLMEGDYVNGKEEGEWLNYWDSGALKNKATFSAGELEGEWFSYYPDGKQKLEGTYKDNMKVGEWIEYFSNGKLKDVVTYKLFKKKTKMDYGIMKDHVVYESKEHGKSESYSAKDFRLTEEGIYKEGLKDGGWIAYHPGGKNPAVSTEYKKGKLHGKMKQYSRRGKLLSEIDYKEGLKHGSFIMYDKKGKVIKELKYERGMQIIEGSTNSPGSFTPGR